MSAFQRAFFGTKQPTFDAAYEAAFDRAFFATQLPAFHATFFSAVVRAILAAFIATLVTAI